MNKLRIQCSPFTGTIYAGRPNKDGTAWSGEKHDVTSDVIGAIIEKIGAGHIISVNENGQPAYEIEVRDVRTVSTEGTQEAPEEVRDGWISVDERLPELYQTVALLDEKRWMNTGSDDHSINWHGSGYLCEGGHKYWSIFGEMRSQCLDAVTHWMPLPAAPGTEGGAA